MAYSGQWMREELLRQESRRELHDQAIGRIPNGPEVQGPRGEVYHNEGEVQIPMITEGGHSTVGEFQVIN